MSALKRRLSLADKRRLLELYDRLPAMSQRKAAATLNVPPSQIWSCLHNRSTIMNGESLPRRKGSFCKFPRLEVALWTWIDHCTINGDPASELTIHRKAVFLASRMGLTRFRATPKWYSGFKSREAMMRDKYGIYPRVDPNHQPKPDTDSVGSVSSTQTTQTTQTTDQDSRGLQETPRSERPDPSSSSSSVMVIRTEPAVIRTEQDEDMKSITVPSVLQMKDAMDTLATGLLYRGFCDFKLLHHFKKAVEEVVKRSVEEGCQGPFIA